MTDNYRWERITRLLKEVEYEVTRGMMDGEIDETIGFSFVIPLSRRIQGGVVHCEFRTRPVHHSSMMYEKPWLRVVE